MRFTSFTNLILARTWLAAPPTFATSSSSYFRQDYEVEVFWEQRPGSIFHAYGLWRDVKVGGFGARAMLVDQGRAARLV